MDDERKDATKGFETTKTVKRKVKRRDEKYISVRITESKNSDGPVTLPTSCTISDKSSSSCRISRTCKIIVTRNVAPGITKQLPVGLIKPTMCRQQNSLLKAYQDLTGHGC